VAWNVGGRCTGGEVGICGTRGAYAKAVEWQESVLWVEARSEYAVEEPLGWLLRTWRGTWLSVVVVAGGDEDIRSKAAIGKA